MPSTPCRILLVDDDQTILQLFTAALVREGFDVLTAAGGQEALGKVAENRVQAVLVDINLPDLSGIEVMRRIVKTSSIAVILITGDDGRYSYEAAVREGAADFILKPVRLSELALRIRQALEVRRLAEAKERLVADLERMAVRDEMTGLFNYRHFQSQLRAEVQRCLRYERPLSLIIFDADHFKEINDSFGHAEGDRVLAGIAHVLRTAVRATDTVFRYGGEEFATLLPETHGNQALGVADRARQQVESARLLRDRPVTVSAGVAELRPAEQGEDLLRRADSALYAAKGDGRNRTVLA